MDEEWAAQELLICEKASCSSHSREDGNPGFWGILDARFREHDEGTQFF